jgi:hypothetical protein
MMNRILVSIVLLGLIFFIPACNQSTSSNTPALKITPVNLWLSDVVDVDGDGYASYLHLNMDLDVNRNSIEIIAVIGVRLHDPADTAGYYMYFQSPPFDIGGEGSDDAVYAGIGDPNPELPQAEWDFAVLIYLSSNTEDPVIGFDLNNVPDLGQIAMEEVVTDGGILIYDAWWQNQMDIDGDGYFSQAMLGVDVDVPSGSTANVYLDLFAKTSVSSSYLYFGSTNTFSVDGESETDAVGINFDDAFAHNTYDFKINAMVYNGDVVEDFVDKSTSGPIGDELGNVPFELASEDVQQTYTVNFTNQVFTSINIGILNYSSKTIPVGGSVSYQFSSNPGLLRFTASTSGKTNTGTQIGSLVSWQGTFSFSSQPTLTYNLVLSSDMFYMYMKNTGTKNLSPIYVNYNLTDVSMDNILIPPDGVTYNIGYYNAHTNTEVRGYWSGEPGSYSYWQQGVHFTLPFTQNQSVTLFNTSKNGINSTSALVHESGEVNETSPAMVKAEAR